MKRIIVVISIFFTVHVTSAHTPYLKAAAGISSLSDAKAKVTLKVPGAASVSDFTDFEYDSAVSLNAAIGLDYENGYRLELHFSTRENDGNLKLDKSEKVEQRSNTLGVNFIREFYLGRLVPFVSAGAGFIFSEIKPASAESLKDTTMSLNVGGGITYILSDTLSLYGQYNYYLSGDFEDMPEDDVEVEIELGLHQFALGITQSF